MAVIGVVCEYNPFHRGHQLHIERSRAALGEESAVLCVLSGDFVQRGEAAVYDKFARAEAACRGGADLVIELPLPWCLSSAEGFARGAVHLLASLGATHLSFGSESGALSPLEKLAETLLEPAFLEEVKSLLARDPSLSFAAARERAAQGRLGETALLLRSPNDILAVEYLKALRERNLPLAPLAIRREGAGHDRDAAEGELFSASQLRQLLREGRSIAAQLPSSSAAVYDRERAAGRELSDPAALETAILCGAGGGDAGADPGRGQEQALCPCAAAADVPLRRSGRPGGAAALAAALCQDPGAERPGPGPAASVGGGKRRSRPYQACRPAGAGRRGGAMLRLSAPAAAAGGEIHRGAAAGRGRGGL